MPSDTVMPTTTSKKAKHAVTIDSIDDEGENQVENICSTSTESHTLTLSTEIIYNILQLCDTPTLVNCLSASHQLYTVAGSFLYRHIVIDDKTCMRDVLAGQASRHSFKANLVSNIVRLTVRSHCCRTRLRSKTPISNLKTLLVVPSVSCHRPLSICHNDFRPCPILRGARAQKVVLHNIVPQFTSRTIWPLGQNECIQIDTDLVLVFRMDFCPNQQLPYEADYSGIDMTRLKRLRLIAAPRHWRHSSFASRYFEISEFVRRFVAPAVAWLPVPVDIYLFPSQRTETWPQKDVIDTLEDDFAYRETKAAEDETSTRVRGSCRPDYTIKSLEEYIEEGWSDEFLPQELAFWRSKYEERATDRRKAESTAVVKTESDDI